MNFSFEEIVHPLGLTLLDSLWQGALILLVCGGLLLLLRHKASRIRYYVVLLGLFALPVAAILTFSSHYQPINKDISFGENVVYALPANTTTLAKPILAPDIMDQWHLWASANASYISLFWVLGFALFALRLTGGFYMVHKLKRGAESLVDEYWMAQLSEMAEKLKIKVQVSLLQSVKVTSPIVLGYLKPVIIFPMGLIEGLPTDQIEAILLHELAHIKRFDYLLNVLVSGLQLFFFYHPAYWWLQSQLDSEREYSCDDLVLNHTGNSLSLIKALTAVREFQITGYSPSMAFAGQKNQLLKRVERIMKKKTRTNWLGGLISMSVLLLSFFLMSYQSKQDPQSKADIKTFQIDSLKMFETPSRFQFTLLTDSLKASRLTFGFQETLKARDTFAIEKFRMLPQSNVPTLQQATMDLINREQSGIGIFTDENGAIISLKRNGKKITGETLELYQKAYYRLMKFVEEENTISENVKSIERDLFETRQRLQEIEKAKHSLEQYEAESEKLKTSPLIKERKALLADLRKQLVSFYKNQEDKNADLSKIEALYRTTLLEHTKLMFEMERQVLEMKSKESDMSDETKRKSLESIETLKLRLHELSKYRDELRAPQKLSNNLRELLKYNPEFIKDLKSDGFAGHENSDIIRVKAKSKDNVIRTYELRVGDLRQRKIANGNYTFTEHEIAQERLAKEISEVGSKADNALIVVDGEVRKDWKHTDLYEQQVDGVIKAIKVTAAEKVTDPTYKKLMRGRDLLIEIETHSGTKKAKRLELIQKDVNALFTEEVFTKKMLENMKADGLLTKGWSSLELSSRELIINGKNQPKKTLKKYLKLYKEITGKSLSKNKSIRLKE